MHKADEPTEQIEHIRTIMEQSTTFISLSGPSGFSVGILGLGATWLVYRLLGTLWLTNEVVSSLIDSQSLVGSIASVLLGALVVALAAALFFAWRRAKRFQHDLWNLSSRRFAIHLALPLLVGGIFVMALAQHGTYELICPAMLVFFGLALVNAGKYNFSETVTFGGIELVLGVLAVFWVEAGLLLWGIGFGVVTIGYGIIMYLKYER